MFLEQALKQDTDLSQPMKILDLCAAPGGKSTHIQSLISKDSILVSNEPIRSRAHVLKHNIIKWGCSNTLVTQNDPADFAGLRNYFDVIVVDAPCSGSGLFRRDPETIQEWSPGHVQFCSRRQQRIIADIWPALKNEGVLIYSTCSYSKEEDEELCEWIMKEFPVIDLRLQVHDHWSVIESSIGYRFWPYQSKGEGFFLAVFRKKGEENHSYQRIKNKLILANTKELGLLSPWIRAGERAFIKKQNSIFAWPENGVSDLALLSLGLRIIYAGVSIGEPLKGKLLPDHALAMSTILSDRVNRIALQRNEAIQYLQRKELRLETTGKGWQLVTYSDFPLGWVNVLPNRVNNYYPQALRILKDY